jgi:hypothetical protein
MHEMQRYSRGDDESTLGRPPLWPDLDSSLGASPALFCASPRLASQAAQRRNQTIGSVDIQTLGS